MNWAYLLPTGIFNIGWTIGLKLMENHINNLWPDIFNRGMLKSFYFMQFVLKAIAIGTGYAFYRGLGAIRTAIIGIMFLKEPANIVRIGFILLIISLIVEPELT